MPSILLELHNSKHMYNVKTYHKVVLMYSITMHRKMVAILRDVSYLAGICNVQIISVNLIFFLIHPCLFLIPLILIMVTLLQTFLEKRV